MKEKSKIWKTVDEPAPKKFKEAPFNNKVMASVFWDQKGVILDYLPNMINPETGSKYTVSGDRYHNTLVKLWMVIKAKGPGMLTKDVVFLYDNACSHRKDIVTRLLDDFKWKIVYHPAYSPDTALLDYHAFPDLKKDLVSKWFADEASLKAALSTFFGKMDSSWYAQGIEKLIFRYNKCLNICGDYIEK